MISWKKQILLCFFTFFLFQFLVAQQSIKSSILPIPFHPAPVVEFSVLNLCYGDSVHFINQTLRNFNPKWSIYQLSSSAIIDSSSDTNLVFKFPSPGKYNITLSADNGHFVDITKEITIDSFPHVKAEFNFQQCTMQFINMSSCSSSFKWDFGDNTFSTNPFPIHNYEDTGSYAVKLIAFNGYQSDTLINTIHVDDFGYPNPIFTYTHSLDTFFFHAVFRTGTFYWNFGDQSNPASGKDTIHVFKDTGYFYVTLVMYNTCGARGYYDSIHVLFPDFHKLDTTQLTSLIYPNPLLSSQLLNYLIYSPQVIDIDMAIYDLLGKKIFTIPKHLNKGINAGTIDISLLDSGVYILKIDAEIKERYFVKLIIQNQ